MQHLDKRPSTLTVSRICVGPSTQTPRGWVCAFAAQLFDAGVSRWRTQWLKTATERRPLGGGQQLAGGRNHNAGQRVEVLQVGVDAKEIRPRWIEDVVAYRMDETDVDPTVVTEREAR